MTPEQIAFVAAAILLSCIVAFVCWLKVRVVRLRQDLFAIRDELFDAAVGLRATRDPAYERARSRLHGQLHLAGMLDGFLVRSCVNANLSSSPPICTQNAALQAAIDTAFEKSAQRLYRYVVYETVSGALLYRVDPRVRAHTPRAEVRAAAERAVKRVVEAPEMQDSAPSLACV